MLLFIFKCMLICSLTGSVLIVLMCLLRPLTERFFSSSWHYVVGLCIMLIMICPIRISVPEKAVSDSPVHTETVQPAKETDKVFENITVSNENVESREKDGFGLTRLVNAFSYAWAVTAVLLLLKKRTAYAVYMRKILRQTEEVTDIEACAKKHLRIRRGECISSPMVAGLISPTLFLPDIPLSGEEIKMIVSHEAVHLQRRDIVAKRLVSFVKCIHFFNPFVYLMARSIDLDCEISCDLAATKRMSGEEKKSYMLTILNLISYGKVESPAFTAGILSGKDTLKRRFFKIKNREKISKKTKLISAFIALTLIFSCLLVSGVFAAELKKPEINKSDVIALFGKGESEKALTDENEKPLMNGEDQTDGASNETTEAALTETEYTLSADEKPVLEPTTAVTQSTHTGDHLHSEKHHHSSHYKDYDESDCRMIYPCDERSISSDFGDNDGRHNGIDFCAEKYSEVYASANGKVIWAGYDGSDGNKIKLIMYDNKVLVYCHLDSISVEVHEEVECGQVIGKVGSTGASTGPHLHFSVMKDGKYVNPKDYLE